MRLAHDTSACEHQQLPQLPAVLGAALHLPGFIAATVEQAPGALIDLLETAAAWQQLREPTAVAALQPVILYIVRATTAGDLATARGRRALMRCRQPASRRQIWRSCCAMRAVQRGSIHSEKLQAGSALQVPQAAADPLTSVPLAHCHPPRRGSAPPVQRPPPGRGTHWQCPLT